MTQAVTVRRDGDTFQARLFWLQAARLLDPASPIIKVGFENGPKSFDDIWIEYDPARSGKDQHGEALRRLHVQCKWHVTPNIYGYSHLVDPEFINASARSLMQRAREAQLAYAPDGSGVQFKLVTNWQLDNADPLRGLVRNRSGTLDIGLLYGSLTDNSKMGVVRKIWREHLGIDEDELRLLVRTLAFREATDSLDDLREQIDTLLGFVGLRRVPMNESAFFYDDLVFQWMAQGRVEFDRASFRMICDQEGLVAQGEDRPLVYSWDHWTKDGTSTRAYTVLNPNLKLGITNSTEFDMFFPVYNSLEIKDPNSRFRASGFGDILVGGKINFSAMMAGVRRWVPSDLSSCQRLPTGSVIIWSSIC